MEKIKYFKYLFIILFIFVIGTFALGKVNNDFKQISDNNSLNIYTNSDKSIYIAKINLERVDIDFGGVLTENIENKYESNITKNERFNRISSYDLVKFPKNENILGALNGQFFNANLSTTFLSFPVKSDGKIISSYMDNKLQKRTFIIDENGIPKIFEGFNNGFLENKNNKDVIAGIHPEENFLKDRKLPRNFMGIIDNKNIIFVLAKAKTQEDMVKIMQNQGIKFENIIMFDGGPSSQMSYIEKGEDKSFIHQVYGGWKVPHFFLIREKR